MNIENYIKKNKRNLIKIFLIVYDLIAINFSYLFALLLRFDFSYSKIDPKYLNIWTSTILVYSVFCLAVFFFLKLYDSILEYVSYKELARVMMSSAITSLFYLLITLLIFGRMPVSFYVFGAMIQFVLVLGIRFSYRFINLLRKDRSSYKDDVRNNVMVIGAGDAAQRLIHDTDLSKTGDKICCIIDDNPNKWNKYIDGIKVVGGREKIASAVNEYKINKIYFAILNTSALTKKEILQICNETGCEVKVLSGLFENIENNPRKSLKNVKIEDLLGRDPVTIDLTQVYDQLNDKVVLVTGGGGSIGSEICRQVASHNPKQLIIVDIYENNAYDIEQELKDNYPNLNLVVKIASVRDSRKVFQIFERYQPNIVYHAAAHKHVPLMENSPCEAIKNNTIGTYKTAYAAMANGCEKFVLISTDKAVNPTNIMGASKRLCEMIIQTFDYYIKTNKVNELPELFTHDEKQVVDNINLSNVKTDFVAVRFGNVLNSNGSVIPLFKKQIEKGGPITVTHPDIVRYFMTIPEAVSLVLTAGTYAKGGEIFVLDMGTQVKIDDLARNLIKLSGLKPGVDIEIKYTGLRPGEKLYEEKLMDEEGLSKTNNNLIYIGKPINIDYENFLKDLSILMEYAYLNKNENVIDMVKKMVVTYHPNMNN